MQFADKYLRAQAHQESYRLLLDLALHREDRYTLVRKAGISVRYLDKIRSRAGIIPSGETAEKIARAVSLSREQQFDLLNHMISAEEEGIYDFVADEGWVREHAISELNRSFNLATYALTPQMANVYYEATLTLGKALLPAFYKMQKSLEAAYIHIVVHDVACVLGYFGEGFYHASMSNTILSSLDNEENTLHSQIVFYNLLAETEQRISFSNLHTNSFRVLAVAYNHFDFSRKAVQLCEQAISTPDAKREPGVWYTNILRDKIGALTALPKSDMTEIENSALTGLRMCEKYDKDLEFMLLSNGLARAYLVRGYVEKAETILKE